jgi:hypothetical protein
LLFEEFGLFIDLSKIGEVLGIMVPIWPSSSMM